MTEGHSTALVGELLARCDFPDTGELFCAVSGGADSLALLVLATATGRPTTAIHVDHGLRPESSGEAEVVAKAAQRFGARFVAHAVAVTPGPNLEARARAARYSVLPEGVLTGHTADDQAETVLINLMRGSGLDGLAGMRPTGHPLLAIRRAETHALCLAVQLTPVLDASNESSEFVRNRVRSEVLPLLDDVAQRDVAAVIGRQARTIRSAVEVLDEMAAELDPTDAVALSRAHPEIAARALRMWLRSHMDGEQHPLDAKATARVLAVARGESTSCDVANGVRVSRSRQRLRIEPRTQVS